jgi:hypothetical protein
VELASLIFIGKEGLGGLTHLLPFCDCNSGSNESAVSILIVMN